jgi:hypothetical protein
MSNAQHTNDIPPAPRSPRLSQWLVWAGAWLGIALVANRFGWLGSPTEKGLVVLLALVWVLSAMVTNKLDAMFVGEPTNRGNATWSLFLWPVIALYLLFCKHHVNNGCKDYWDY